MGSYCGVQTDPYHFGYLLIENRHPSVLIPSKAEGGWYGCKLTVTNTSKHGTITDLVVSLDLDDDSQNWDVMFMNGAWEKLPNPTVTYASLAPGQSQTLSYKISPQRLGNENGTNFTCTINIYPSFHIHFHGSTSLSGKLEVDVSRVPKLDTGGFN